jgi:hypothetical protein
VNINVEEITERIIMEIIARDFHQTSHTINDFVEIETKMVLIFSSIEK